MADTTVAAILARLDDPSGRGYLALSDLMEFDCPITVHADGRITDAPRDLYAPDLYDGELQGDGWTLLDGYSGQDRYAGPIMHSSEFIGGGMARDILAEPGTYVAVVCYWSPTCRECGAEVYEDGNGAARHLAATDAAEFFDADADADHTPEADDDNIDGWAVARLDEDAHDRRREAVALHLPTD